MQSPRYSVPFYPGHTQIVRTIRSYGLANLKLIGFSSTVTGVTPFVLSEGLYSSSGQAGSPSSSTYNRLEKQPLRSSETSPFLDPSSSTNRRDVHDMRSTNSAFSDGHVRKSSRRNAPTPGLAPISETPSMGEVGTQSPVSTVRSDGSFLDYHQNMMDNQPPPAYYHKPAKGRSYS